MSLEPFLREWASKSYAREFIQCARKVLILTEQEANEQAARMMEKYYEIFLSYNCPFCGGYHIGRLGPTKEKRFLKQRVDRIKNAFNVLTPRLMKDWTEVL